MHASPRPRRHAALTSTLLCSALVLTAAPAAHAGGHRQGPAPTADDAGVVAAGLLSPLSLATGARQTVYVSQNFAGRIDAVRRGEVTTVVEMPDTELGALSTQGQSLYFASTPMGPGSPTLWVRDARGDVEPLADLGAYEDDHNPDADVRYGLPADLPAECVEQIPANGPQPSYPGVVESHPYGSTSWRGEVFVADAGANTVVAVDRDGDIRTVAVLPPVEATLTDRIAEAIGLPDCLVGVTLLLEPVPTDVEVGKGGWLYVTTLPGGPEEPGLLPPLGAVYAVHPRTGETRLLAQGFAGATNLAVSPRGDVYVTELFGNRVSVVPRGSSTPQTFLEAVLPAAIELDGRTLYVTTEIFPADGAPPNGKVLAVPLGH